MCDDNFGQDRMFVALAQNSSDFIGMAALDGRILFVNDAGRRLLGIDPECDVRGMTLPEFHTEEGLKRRAILRARGHWEGYGHLRHLRTKALIPTRVSSFLLRDGMGAPLCYATVQRDQREARRLEEHVRQAQKMDALGALALGIAHDLNNLLAVVLTCGWMLRDRLAAESSPGALADEMCAAAERAVDLTRQLLTFARREPFEPRIANLNDVLAGMERMTMRLLGQNVDLEMALEPGLRPVTVDRAQMEQVIMNLAVNARDAMPRGGRLVIRTRNVEFDEPVAQQAGISPGPHVALDFTDDGVGMDEATMTRIFEPFFTTKEPGKGTGLGLSTVFGIVQQSGGRVSVRSEVGKGTTFTVVLPVSAPTAR
jgi:PAS domain S-box-containing protein